VFSHESRPIIKSSGGQKNNNPEDKNTFKRLTNFDYEKNSKQDYRERREISTDNMKTFAIKRIKRQQNLNLETSFKKIPNFSFLADERKRMLKQFNILSTQCNGLIAGHLKNFTAISNSSSI
jgi:hypothetical protein